MSLTIKNLKVELQKNEILHGVSLHAEEGEFVSLLGASGCGKSTLLKSIAGLCSHTSGEVLVQGKDLQNTLPEHRGTVIVFQDLRLFPHMTVERNIGFAMELKGIPAVARQIAVHKLLDEVQLSGYGKRRTKEMSGGQLQRVALARALAAEPKVLLLDEPFSGLDEKLRNEMGVLVKRLHQERTIITIMVTHDKKEALQMSDKIAFMHEGRIVQFDTPQNIFNFPVSQRAAEYFGKGSYIEGIVEGGKFRSNEIRIKTEVKEGFYRALIRPSAVRPIPGGQGNTVMEIIFMGETTELKIKTSSGIIMSHVASSEVEKLEITAGQETGLHIDRAGVCYFLADSLQTGDGSL